MADCFASFAFSCFLAVWLAWDEVERLVLKEFPYFASGTGVEEEREMINNNTYNRTTDNGNDNYFTTMLLLTVVKTQKSEVIEF